jgi:hypothetical protein
MAFLDHVAGVGGKVPGLASEGALDPVGELGVAAIEDGGEEVVQEGDEVGGELVGFETLDEIFPCDLLIMDVSTGGLGDLFDGHREAEQFGSGQFVELAGVPIVGEGGDGDLGDVIGVDEGFDDCAGG